LRALSKVLSVLVLALAISQLSGSCVTGPRGAYDSHEDNFAGSRYHTLQRGENLYRLSLQYGVSVEELKRFNNIWDVHDIKTGTRIYIPQNGEAKIQEGVGKRWYEATQQAPDRGAVTSSVKFIWPVRNVDISSRFGVRADSKHTGIDLRNPDGTPVYAAASGKVIFSGDGPSGYGNTIMIKHSNNIITVYAHNSDNLVAEDQNVEQGQKIATVGRTGRASGYHVHFELRLNRKPVDPERYLPRVR